MVRHGAQMSQAKAASAVRSVLEPLETRTLLSTYYLSPAGNDAAAGTLAAPWRTLNKVAATVSGGDELVLRAGTYTGGQQFDVPNLNIHGYAGDARPLITASMNNSSIQQTLSIGINASGATLR